MYHYIRDCPVYDNGGADNGGMGEINYVYYHFLRTAGWSWVWECDGVADNHCPDGSMEADISSWTIVGGASIAKTTSQKHMLLQSLQVTSSSSSDGVRSASGLASMSTSTTYRLSLWANNGTGQAWDVQVEPGASGYSSVGAIPSDGTWTRYDFSFTTDASGTPSFQVVDINNSQGTIYLDSVMVFESWFEYNGVDAEDFSATPDGQILNNNEFSSVSHLFVAGDVGKYICIWDPTNIGNTGVYRITSTSGTNAVMDLRANGSPVLVSQTGLRWRMIDVTQAPRIYDPGVDTELYAGWGLESPHSEKWRFFMRNNWNTSSDRSWLNTWSSPYDADFDVETGDFSRGEVSTINRRGSYGKGQNGSGNGYMFVGDPDFQDSSFNRLYLQTDDDGSFLFMTARIGDGGAANSEFSQIAGFTGSDSYHTLRESFAHFGRIDATTVVTRTLWWASSSSNTRIPIHGVQVSKGSVDMTWCTWMTLGYGTATAALKATYANPRANPFGSGGSEYMLFRPKIARDYTGKYSSCPSEKDVTTWGIWEGMRVTDYSGIDSNKYFHIVAGVFMEMPSSGGVGLFEPLS